MKLTESQLRKIIREELSNLEKQRKPPVKLTAKGRSEFYSDDEFTDDDTGLWLAGSDDEWAVDDSEDVMDLPPERLKRFR